MEAYVILKTGKVVCLFVKHILNNLYYAYTPDGLGTYLRITVEPSGDYFKEV